MKRLITKLPWVFASAMLVALLVYGYWPQPVEADLAEVTSGSLEVTVDDDGETRIREKYVISAPVAGKLLRVRLNAGDAVQQKTTELVRIQPSAPELLDDRTQAESEARLRAAEASLSMAEAKLRREKEALELAKHDYARAGKLRPQNAISQAEFDTIEHGLQIVEADLRTAESGVKVARFELEHFRAAASQYDVNGDSASRQPFQLVSPIDGRVLQVFKEDAGVVAPGTPLLELGDPRDLEIEIDVLSSDAVKVQPGDTVYIDHWGGPKTLNAVVRIVEPAAFLKVSALGVEEKRVNVIADFVDPWSCRESLGDGFRVEARIVVASTDPNSIKVPSGALFRDGESWKVYRVRDFVAELCTVQIGETNGTDTEIKAGLSQSDLVVLYPTAKIQQGVRVKQAN